MRAKLPIDVALEMSLDRDERHEALLSAIRALVQQWKEQIVELKALLVSTGSADAYLYARRRSEMETLQMVVGDLAALCPAPEQ